MNNRDSRKALGGGLFDFVLSYVYKLGRIYFVKKYIQSVD